MGPLGKLVRWRGLQPLFMLVGFVGFLVPVAGGLWGTPVGSRNSAIILVWILWFSVLVVSIPLLGRLWCFVCPIPLLSNRLSRVGGFGFRWPQSLENTWFQTSFFFLMAALSPVLLFYPYATSLLLIAFVIMAIFADCIFKSRGRRGRIFCRYICPVGGFLGLYSGLGFLKIRPERREVCRECKQKTCVRECPWFLYPGGLERNSYCGLCTECIKVCPHDNIDFRVEYPDKPVSHRMDEVFLNLVMLGSAIFYSAAFFGWFSPLKELSVFIEGPTIGYPFQAERLAGFSLLLVATIFLVTLLYLLGIVGMKKMSPGRGVRELFTRYSYALIPFGFAGWLGFVFYELAFNGAYILPVLSDPLGLGWDLFGTVDYHWRPYLSLALPYVLVVVFLSGLVVCLRWIRDIGRGDTGSVVLCVSTLTIFYIIIYIYIVP